ncbi:MAG: tripartite tricarboxylate transporter substrate-binding protein [Sulfuricaulis sp.]|uniref:Bug family tripartite tricarboxylate transporter substrate binding protein n=1 Tax=Sulfuricaulis sp. TaxID=2003553 RepID=UPI0034A4E750
MYMPRQFLIIALAMLIGCELGFVQESSGASSAYPAKPVRMVIPYGVGGSTDILSRIVALALSERLGVQIVVDNRPGANGRIATMLVKEASADGYTLLMASNGGHTANVTMYAKPGYDPLNDFASVALVATLPMLLAVNSSSAVSSFKDLITLAKTKPRAVTFGHPGVGSSPYFTGKLLDQAADINTLDVPYKSGGAAVVDAIAGNITMVYAGLPAIIQYVKSGMLRPLAVSSAKRSHFLPNIPAISEYYSDFNIVFWVAAIAPRGVPQALVSKLNSEINHILGLQRTIDLFATQGATPARMTPKELDDFIRNDLVMTKKIAKEAGVKLLQ